MWVILKFFGWLFALAVVVPLILFLLQGLVGSWADKRLGHLGPPDGSVSLAEHFGRSIAVVGILGFLLGVPLAFSLRYLTMEFVSDHWLYRGLLIFFAIGMSWKDSREMEVGKLTGKVGMYFEYAIRNTLFGGAFWTFAVLEVITIIRWAFGIT